MMLLQMFCSTLGPRTEYISCWICAYYYYVYVLYTYDILQLECDVKIVVGTKPKLFAI